MSKTPNQLLGSENETHLQVKDGARVEIKRDDKGLWHVEGPVKMSQKNKFRHLRDARSYLFTLQLRETKKKSP